MKRSCITFLCAALLKNGVGERVLIFGNGYIGNKFKAALGDRAVISPADIADAAAVRAALDTHRQSAVINCAGKTGKPNVDWCEDHKEETHRSNVLGPQVLAEQCAERAIHLTHIGSGCVYEGDNGGKGFSEDDLPNYDGSYYSRTKRQSEEMLKRFPVLQLRMRMPVDSVPNDRNLITKLVRYRKVISVPNSVSIIDDFITAALRLMELRRTGVYNVTNPGAIEHREILDAYKELVDPAFSYELMSLDELGKIIKAGRSNCVLSTAKLAAEGIMLPHIRDAIRTTLHRYKQHMPAAQKL